MSKLELAKNKFEKRKWNTPCLSSDFNEFILDCYLDYPPSSYGKYIQDKIIYDCYESQLIRNSDKDNKGDCYLMYPSKYIIHEIDRKDDKYRYRISVPKNFKSVRNFEIKVSFLGKNNHFTIRNIRPYQELNGGYLICLIDCENNFTPELYLLSKEDFFDGFNFTHMNGVDSEHREGGFQNWGTTIGKNSYDHNYLKYYNLLDGNKFENLIGYLKNLSSELKIEFENNKEWNDHINKEFADYFEQTLWH